MSDDELKAIRERFIVAARYSLSFSTPRSIKVALTDIPDLVAAVETLRTNLAVECEATAHLSARIAELEEALQQRQQ